MANPVLDSLYSQRTALLDEIDTVARAVAEGDGRDLSDTETAVIGRARTRIEDDLDPQIEEWERIERTRSQHETRLPNLLPVPAPTPAQDGVVYRTFAQYARDVIVSRYDSIAALAGPGARAQAEERIQRAVVNTLSSDVAGLIRPQYLDQIAQIIDKSRPIVDSARRVNLTSGTLTYPSITTRPSAAKQTAEKTDPSSTKMAVAFVNVTADTYMAAGDLSWQAINWSTPEALGLWFDLAAEQYAIQTEAAAGTVLAAATVMATPAVPASPTLQDWFTAITAAAGVVYTTSRRRADTIYADITTGYGLMGLVSNTGPVFLQSGQLSLATGSGNIAGLRLVISGGLGAKTVVVGDSQSLLAAETASAPVELRAIEPSIGGMEVGVIGAFVAKITDAGGFRKLTVT